MTAWLADGNSSMTIAVVLTEYTSVTDGWTDVIAAAFAYIQCCAIPFTRQKYSARRYYLNDGCVSAVLPWGNKLAVHGARWITVCYRGLVPHFRWQQKAAQNAWDPPGSLDRPKIRTLQIHCAAIKLCYFCFCNIFVDRLWQFFS